jgi:hypothetical protein
VRTMRVARTESSACNAALPAQSFVDGGHPPVILAAVPDRSAATLPPAGFASGVPRPPVGFSIEVPDHWFVLDLNPATWDGWLDAFLDQRLAHRPGAGRERGPACRAMRELLERLHAERVFVAAVLAAEVEQHLVSASATLAWRQIELGGDRISLEGLRETYARAPASRGEDLRQRRVDIVGLPVGRAVKVATREAGVPRAGLTPVASSVTQYLVPVLDTDWLAVITTSTGNMELAPGVEQVADLVATSLVFRLPPGTRRRDVTAPTSPRNGSNGSNGG